MKLQLTAGVASTLLVALLANAEAATIDSASNAVENVLNEPNLDIEEFAKAEEKAESHQFNAEISRLLQILAKNAYTERKVVIREFVSNCKDAIDKQHELALSKGAGNGDLDNLSNYKIVVTADKKNKILSFVDNGVGMTRDELINYLGTIAKSGTAEYASGKKTDTNAANLIGQFGIGFYSSRMIADDVYVSSVSEKEGKQWIWKMGTDASYSITEDPKGNTLGRGTAVYMKIREDAQDEFLDPENLERVLKEYFAHDRHSIYLVKPNTIIEEVPIEDDASGISKPEGDENGVEVEDEKVDGDKPRTKKVEKIVWEEVLISQNTKPVWARDPKDVKPDEYTTLYQMLSGERSGKPIAYTHFHGETANGESFRTVLFIPERPSFNPFSSQEVNADIKLHVRGVFVTAKLNDFIPKYLSFVKGILDSDDLSLNISRDILQNTQELRGVKKKVIRKLIEMMSDLASDEEKYKNFYEAYGAHLKMEIAEREEYRTLLAKLLRFRSTKSGDKWTSFEKYIEDMSETQQKKKVIYYLAGKADEVKKSPFLSRFVEKGYEVMLMTDPVDEHMVQRLERFDDFKLENITKDGILLDEEEEKLTKEYAESFKTASEWIKKSVSDVVDKIVLVDGPASVPGSLKSHQYGWSGNMERLVMAQSNMESDPMLKFFASQKKILELNPKNEVTKAILERANEGKTDQELKATLRALVDAMTISSGYIIKDASGFTSRIERLARKAMNLPTEDLTDESPETKVVNDNPYGDLNLDNVSEQFEKYKNSGVDSSPEDAKEDSGEIIINEKEEL